MLKALLKNNATQEDILAYLKDQHAYDIAQSFDGLDDDEIDHILKMLEPDLVAEIVAYLHPTDAANIISSLSLEAQKSLVEELEPDDAADIINELEKEERSELINILDQDEEVLSLIAYEEETAGSYMTNDFIFVHLDDDVKSATKKVIHEAKAATSLQTIFVVDDAARYIGQITLKNLIKAKAPKTVADILELEPTVKVDEHVDELVKHMKHYGGYDIGVVNDQNVLLGAITMDDILDIYQEEAFEDIEKLSALPDIDFEQNVFLSALKRLPWLIILMVLSIPIAYATSHFEEVISGVVILALFQPLILDSGGDVASQTLAVTLIALTKQNTHAFKNGVKEIISGMMSGFVMGLLALLATFVFGYVMALSHTFEMALVVGISLFLTVTLAPLFGFLIPIILKLFKFDPAVASGPFITTLIDIVSVLIYFGLATMLLGGVVSG